MWDEVRGSSPFVLLVWFGFLPGFPFFLGGGVGQCMFLIYLFLDYLPGYFL